MEDIIVVGGGPAGMSASLSASKNGSTVCLIERNDCLGGILNQCIHNGFGLKYYKEELTGPEYASRLIKEIKKNKKIKVLTNTFVTKINKDNVEIINEKGKQTLFAKAIILAMGCRERTAGNILLNGTRPAGILTAGQAQKLVNCYGKLPGKKAVILGSGDIGLIMARRLTFEGCKVVGVYEINSNSSGLKRNIVQCLDDYSIPLYLNTTITRVVGTSRVEGVYICKVDENFKPILSTQKLVKCDSIILSVGLIPETDLINEKINPKTNSFYVDDHLQTENGFFACGNVLHVHDLVDNVTLESFDAGEKASLYVNSINNNNQIKLGENKNQDNIINQNKQMIDITFDDNISYTVPNKIIVESGMCTIKFRVKHKLLNCSFVIKCLGNEIKKQKVLAVNSGEMQTITFDKSMIKNDINLEVCYD